MISGLTSAIFNPMDASKTLEFTSDDGMYFAINYTPWHRNPTDDFYYTYKMDMVNYTVLHDDVNVGRKLNKLVNRFVFVADSSLVLRGLFT